MILRQRHFNFHDNTNRRPASADFCDKMPLGSAGIPGQAPKQPVKPAFRFLRLSADQLDGLVRRNDGDALILPAQAEQMLVAGDDQTRLSGQGASEHMIVVGIVLDHARHHLWRGHGVHAPQFPDDALRRHASLHQAGGELFAR